MYQNKYLLRGILCLFIITVIGLTIPHEAFGDPTFTVSIDDIEYGYYFKSFGDNYSALTSIVPEDEVIIGWARVVDFEQLNSNILYNSLEQAVDTYVKVDYASYPKTHQNLISLTSAEINASTEPISTVEDLMNFLTEKIQNEADDLVASVTNNGALNTSLLDDLRGTIDPINVGLSDDIITKATDASDNGWITTSTLDTIIEESVDNEFDQVLSTFVDDDQDIINSINKQMKLTKGATSSIDDITILTNQIDDVTILTNQIDDSISTALKNSVDDVVAIGVKPLNAATILGSFKTAFASNFTPLAVAGYTYEIISHYSTHFWSDDIWSDRYWEDPTFYVACNQRAADSLKSSSNSYYDICDEVDVIINKFNTLDNTTIQMHKVVTKDPRMNILVTINSLSKTGVELTQTPEYDNAISITSQLNDKCLEAGSKDGANVMMWDCHDENTQKYQTWVWKKSNNEIISNGKCLDISGASNDNGANLILWDCHGGNNQTWTLTDKGEIVSKRNGNCLDISGASTVNDANIIMWECNGGDNQKWTIDGDTITSQLNGKCLEIDGVWNGANIMMGSCPDAQIWTTTDDGEIVSQLNGKCLDISGENKENGADVVMWECGEVNEQPELDDSYDILDLLKNNLYIIAKENQVWESDDNDAIVSQFNDKCLDIQDYNKDNGANIIMWDCHGGDNQTWGVIDQSSPIYNSDGSLSESDITTAATLSLSPDYQWCDVSEEKKKLIGNICENAPTTLMKMFGKAVGLNSVNNASPISSIMSGSNNFSEDDIQALERKYPTAFTTNYCNFDIVAFDSSYYDDYDYITNIDIVWNQPEDLNDHTIKNYKLVMKHYTEDYEEIIELGDELVNSSDFPAPFLADELNEYTVSINPIVEVESGFEDIAYCDEFDITIDGETSPIPDVIAPPITK